MKFLSILLAAALLFTANPVSACAASEQAPLTIVQSAAEAQPVGNGGAAEAESRKDFVLIFREYMKARTTPFTISLETETSYDDYQNELNAFIDEFDAYLKKNACAHTGNPQEGDYLRYQYSQWVSNISPSGTPTSEGTVNWTVTFTFTVDYYTTADQETWVTDKIAEILTELNLTGKSDYEKVKAIHDYICSNVDYDYENVNNDALKTQYTAYGALHDGKAVCQGYTALFYRLCLEAGLDARIVAGTGTSGGTSEAHAWNIVKLGDLYYNVDVTWDNVDPENVEAGGSKVIYDYFLKGSSFEGHTPEEEYLADEFTTAYPMSAVDYVIPGDSGDDEPDDPNAQPAFSTMSLTLGGRIGVNFLMDLPNVSDIDYPNSYMEFTVSGKTGTVTTDKYDSTNRGKNGTYKFTCLVNALQMADTITAVYHYTQGEAEKTLTTTYSVEDYIRAAEDMTFTDDYTKPLIHALADYGYHAQIYLSELRNFTIGDASADHKAMTKYYTASYPSVTAESLSSAIAGSAYLKSQSPDIQGMNCSLVLDSDTSLYVYLIPAEGFSGSISISATNEKGQSVAIQTESDDGLCRIIIPGIGAHNLKAFYTVKVTTPNGVSEMHISAMTYVKELLKGTVTEKEKNLLAALTAYSQAAENYVNH